MLIDANDIDAGRMVEADLCVIGAGAAGITIAREFLGSRTSVCLLEGGSLEDNAASDALYTNIRNVGRDYPLLDQSRVRFFGGSTNAWGGHCVPLRAINFERLPWSHYSGWPISLSDLDPYYQRAEPILGIENASCDPIAVAAKVGQELFPFNPNHVVTQISRYNRVRFGHAFKHELSSARNISVLLNANVTSIEAHKEGRKIERVVARTLGDREFGVRARIFVLATGGIENPRLLLASKSVHGEGLGNAHDLVGRFFMEHIWYKSGLILPKSPHTPIKLYASEMPAGKIAYRAHLILPEKVVRDAGIPDFRTEIAGGHSWQFSAAVRSANALRDGMKRLEWPDEIGTHLANIIRDPGEAISAATDGQPPFSYRLKNSLEQAPNPESRINLTGERDAIGMPIATIDWRLSDIDKQGIRFAHSHIAREVGRSGFGRMLVELPEDEQELLTGANGIGHHMGTTRMHDSERLGVVDRNCRVHGIGNLYVAGSSVFPTGGFANPTLTIVALAVRLADHLRGGLHASQ